MKAESQITVDYNGNKQRYISAALSAVFMGLGQLFNKQYIKGSIFILYTLSLLFTTVDKFASSLKGLVTLGTTPIEDHSLFLMIEGIVAAFLLLVIIGIHLFNVWDAYKNGQKIDLGEEVPSLKGSIKNLTDNFSAYLYIGPGMLMMLVSVIFPIIFTVLIAFTNYNINNLPPGNIISWVGFRNFTDLIHLASWRATFVRVFSWTVVWAVLSTFMSYATGLFLAIVLNNPKIKFRHIFRTVMMISWAIPGFISMLIWRGLLNVRFGHINRMLTSIGFEAIPWLNEAMWARVSALGVNLWLSFPFTMAVCLGLLQSIPGELYEAATVDGATGLQKFKSITLPLVLKQLAPLLIMQFAMQFNNFGIIYLLNNGGPARFGAAGNAGDTDILISWVYKLTLEVMRFDYAAAVSILIFFMVGGFSIWQFVRTKSFKEEELVQ
ncbi:carbohydrate ABC transporter permease [Halonatronum saccharophilum]|uniref:carbohydrate ABC transporter permease n=1 Tax=Halonatronum saccharophilum TaxID=150060 RepID=UPI000480F1E2|nr:sugar ABC transporter permease [Halonatronum saccharophilum]